MSRPPLVSVVIPAYRPGPWLVETLASVAAQSWRPLEIVLIDDGNDVPLTEPAIGEVPLRLIRQDHAGVSAARNRGLAAAQGEFVAFLDADDVWLPDAAAVLARELRGRAACGAVHGRTCRFAAAEPGAPRRLLGSAFHGYNTGSILYRRAAIERIGGFDRNFAFGEDFDVLVRFQEGGFGRALIDDLVLLYRRGHGSTTEAAGVADDHRASFKDKALALAANLARRRHGSGT